jgi:hypothetical protein
MRHSQTWRCNQWVVTALIIIACLQLAACAQTASASNEGEGAPPARVERVAGTGLNRVILTAEAAKRLGIQTAPVIDMLVGGKQREIVPYAAVLYDLHGETWVYTNPAPLTYVRDGISVDFIDGDLAVLSQGPPTGTAVVTVGVVELYGTEFEGGYDEF